MRIGSIDPPLARPNSGEVSMDTCPSILHRDHMIEFVVVRPLWGPVLQQIRFPKRGGADPIPIDAEVLKIANGRAWLVVPKLECAP
jgi:hypothetical protein